MNTRKINELPVLQQATQETNVLVEHGGTASRIPASALGGGGGASEKNIIDKLAPAFTKTGSVVTCNPVEGHPLEVVSQLTYSNPELLKFAEYTEDDNQGIVYWQVHAPAGEYILWGKSYDDVSVEAYDDKSGNWVSIGTLHLTTDEEANAGEDTLTFAHEGGLLRVVATPAYEGATLKLATDPKTFSAAVLEHNGESIMAEFPQAVSSGSFNWSTGVLTVISGGGVNLIPVDLEDSTNWSYDEDSGFYSYELDLPEGEYTIHVNVALCLDFTWMANVNGDIEPMTEYLNDTSFTFYHNGGTVSFVETNGITDHVEIVEAEHFEYHQLTPHEILGLPGVNTLRSSTGDTEVSGRADPAVFFAEQEARIAALEAALLNA